jgi:ribosome-binding protein aMBF1 (putative translation factor)
MTKRYILCIKGSRVKTIRLRTVARTKPCAAGYGAAEWRQISSVHIGTALKSLRERSGFTQSNIAKHLKVDQSLISKFETGERALTADMLEKRRRLGVESFSDYLERI